MGVRARKEEGEYGREWYLGSRLSWVSLSFVCTDVVDIGFVLVFSLWDTYVTGFLFRLLVILLFLLLLPADGKTGMVLTDLFYMLARFCFVHGYGGTLLLLDIAFGT